jgi:hypothetical protein
MVPGVTAVVVPFRALRSGLTFLILAAPLVLLLLELSLLHLQRLQIRIRPDPAGQCATKRESEIDTTGHYFTSILNA